MTKEERIAKIMKESEVVDERIARERSSKRYISPYSKEIADSLARHIEECKNEYAEEQKAIEGLDITIGDLHFAERFYAGKIRLDTASEEAWLDEAKTSRDVLIKAGKWTDEYEMQYRAYMSIHEDDVSRKI